MNLRSVIEGLCASRARAASDRYVRQAGGSEIVHAEDAERAERAAAVPVSHDRIRQVFRLETRADLNRYFNDGDVLDILAAATDLSPPETSRRFMVSTSGHGGADTIPSDSGGYYEITARKGYALTNMLGGTCHLRTARFSLETSLKNLPRPQRSYRDYNPSPGIAFSYFERRLDRSDLHGYPRRIRRKHGYVGGIKTSNLQFAVVVHDGCAPAPEGIADFAGFRNHGVGIKTPLRICLLGELLPSNEEVAVHRILVDGERLPVTERNVDRALNLAAELVATIFRGEALATRARKARHPLKQAVT